MKDKVVIITGASRGIGEAIAKKLAEHGAIVICAAKTIDFHPKLEGSLNSVVSEICKNNGRAVAYKLDVRSDQEITRFIQYVIAEFGKIDILINNAGAINLSLIEDMPAKQFDLINQVNYRATYLLARESLLHLQKTGGHMLTMSPPLNMDLKWFTEYPAYTISKYNMTMLSNALAAKYKTIKVNTLWPKTPIATSAVSHNFPQEVLDSSRTVDIMVDASVKILSSSLSGQNLIDEDVLGGREQELTKYKYKDGADLIKDLYID